LVGSQPRISFWIKSAVPEAWYLRISLTL
jgi:hypothetical protein